MHIEIAFRTNRKQQSSADYDHVINFQISCFNLINTLNSSSYNKNIIFDVSINYTAQAKKVMSIMSE